MTSTIIANFESSPSYWYTTATESPQGESFCGEIAVDVAVIGGGYSGLSTSLHLLERGLNVAILEAGEVGEQASGRANGLVIPTLKKEEPEAVLKRLGDKHGPLMCAMLKDSASYVFELIEKYKIDCDAEQSGWIQPAHSSHHADIAAKRTEQWQALGADVTYFDREQTAKVVGSELYTGSWKANTGGVLQPKSYAHGLAKVVLGLGGKIFTNSPALEIYRQGKRWQIKTARGTLLADQIVIATNATTPKSLWKDLSKTIIPAKFFQLVTQPLTEAQREIVLPGREGMSDMQNDLYFARFDRFNRLITGGALIHEKNWETRLDALVLKRLQKIFPSVQDYTFSNHWSGTVGMTMDYFPRIFSLAPGVWSWMGCNGRGIALATNMGRVMADLIEGKDANELPLPVEQVKGIPCNDLLTALSLYSLLYYRAEDYYYREFG